MAKAPANGNLYINVRTGGMLGKRTPSTPTPGGHRTKASIRLAAAVRAHHGQTVAALHKYIVAARLPRSAWAELKWLCQPHNVNAVSVHNRYGGMYVTLQTNKPQGGVGRAKASGHVMGVAA